MGLVQDTVQINYCNSHFLLWFLKLLINMEKCCIEKLLKEKCDQTIHCKIKGQLNISDMNQENVE